MNFTPAALERMRRRQLASLQDEGVHLIRHASEGKYGEDTVTYVDGTTYKCGFDPTGDNEVTVNGETVTSSATLRLPSTAAAIGHQDRFRLTKRFGESIAAVEYEVIGNPIVGPSGITINLQDVIP